MGGGRKKEHLALKSLSGGVKGTCLLEEDEGMGLSMVPKQTRHWVYFIVNHTILMFYTCFNWIPR